MVKEEAIKGKKLYMCEACDMYYGKKDLAQQCEDFCNTNKSCNLALIKHAVKPEQGGCCS